MRQGLQIKQPAPILFTQAGYAQLKVKREELLAKREEVLIALQRAREMGDLSENGAYTAARFELSNTDRELRRVEHNLKYGKVIEPTRDGVIGFGSVVTVELKGQEYTYTLVGTEESDPQKNILSLESPIGRALQGKREGEMARVIMPDRELEYQVKKIL
ncbi:MAG: transcription elongation factor GreA [uncultured bacterium]|nr:MAG: transcription elongation factor GreA [uncultured bacterium]KKU44868.1 MAG: Transcription elongation factor GreA [Microgenomates group bacterium GW2011_GWB1_46_7]